MISMWYDRGVNNHYHFMLQYINVSNKYVGHLKIVQYYIVNVFQWKDFISIYLSRYIFIGSPMEEEQNTDLFLLPQWIQLWA